MSPNIQVARDRRTGFPLVRLDENGHETDPFVALLPITKIQVEQWIWQRRVDDREDPFTATLLIERMEHLEWHQAPNKYPEKVRRLIRTPVSQWTKENLPGILATNLSLWTSPEETLQPDVQYPTGGSEWGLLLRWFGARIPDYQHWAITLDSFSQFRTKDLVRGVMQLGFSWAPVVESLLGKLFELTSDNESGLPLMNRGVYELASDVLPFHKITEVPAQTIMRPCVAGESAIWPMLEASGNNWRAVLQPALPVVTIRPWFNNDDRNIDQTVNGGINTFRIALDPIEMPVENGISALGVSGVAKRAINSYFTGRVTMTCRCPICYEDVDPEIFYTDKSLWCYLESRPKSAGDTTPTEDSLVRKHSDERPPRSAGIHQVEAVHRDYLKIARKTPKKVRSVCLSGFTEAGKTVNLLSLWGLITYPYGNSRLPKAFPEKWKFNRVSCSLLDFIRGAAPINIAKQTERMWIDGELPVRTRELQRALRSPVLFKAKRHKWVIMSSNRQVILNFNDFPGEMVTKPVEFAKNENYPNISSTTDVIFLAPAHQIYIADQFLATFSAGLGAVTFENEALDLKKINLILAISQIDRLRFSSNPDEEELLKILMLKPYTLPDKHREDDLWEYFSKMDEVHFKLYSWLSSKVPGLVGTTESYASVRYCGFSACGFNPVKENIKPDVESWLPFEPHPVRIADPLLWLLRDNGVINY